MKTSDSLALQQRRQKRILIAIIVISVMLRVAVALAFGEKIETLPGIFDQLSYHSLAERVASGHGFTFGEPWWPVTGAGEPTAHWSYLYTLYLAGSYALFGVHPLIPRLLQVVLTGIFMPWLAFRISRRTFLIASTALDQSAVQPRFAWLSRLAWLADEAAGAVALLAAAWVAVYGYFVYYSAALMTESLYITVIFWIMDCCLRIYDRRLANPAANSSSPARLWLELGLAIGLAALLRQVFLPVVVVIFGWLLWVEYRLLRQNENLRSVPAFGKSLLRLVPGGLLSGAVILALIIPFTIYNYQRFERFVLLNTNAGYALFWSNHPSYGSNYVPLLSSEEYVRMIPQDLRGLDEAALDQALLGEAIDFIRADPVRYLRLSLDRIPEHFRFWPSASSGRVSNLNRVASIGVALPFMLAGICLWGYRVKKRRLDGLPGALLLLFAAEYTLIHLLSWAGIRYRLPVDAVLLPFAAFALWAILKKALFVETQRST